jgi:hypothetical protein
MIITSLAEIRTGSPTVPEKVPGPQFPYENTRMRQGPTFFRRFDISHFRELFWWLEAVIARRIVRQE